MFRSWLNKKDRLVFPCLTSSVELELGFFLLVFPQVNLEWQSLPRVPQFPCIIGSWPILRDTEYLFCFPLMRLNSHKSITSIISSTGYLCSYNLRLRQNHQVKEPTYAQFWNVGQHRVSSNWSMRLHVCELFQSFADTFGRTWDECYPCLIFNLRFSKYKRSIQGRIVKENMDVSMYNYPFYACLRKTINTPRS